MLNENLINKKTEQNKSPKYKLSPQLISNKENNNKSVNSKTTPINLTNKENTIFTSQLQELVGYFSSIENNNIRQYVINLVKEISKYESEEKAQAYIDEVLGR